MRAAEITTLKPGYFGEGSVDVAPPSKTNEGATRRLAITRDTLVERPAPGINTIPDILRYAAETYGDRNAMGWRDILHTYHEPKNVGGQTKEWTYYELSPYQYITYTQLLSRVQTIAAGLLELGLNKGEMVNIFSQTSANWQIVSLACASLSNPVATAYDNLGEEGLEKSLNEPDCVGLFTNSHSIQKVCTVLARTPTIRYVIYDGKPLLSSSSSPPLPLNVKFIHLDELFDLGKQSTLDVHDRRPSPSDLACIMYTSGSTGEPKGVMMTHANIVASVGSISTILSHHITPSDTCLSYLPLAHVLEYIVEMALLFVGVTLGYGQVKTLTDANVRNCKGDIAEFRPSILIGVPVVWETIRKGIIAKVNASSFFSRAAFWSAVEIRTREIPLLSWIVDKVVLANIHAATGGRLRAGISGGAALSVETQKFLDCVLMPMLQGYGMTESIGMCSLLPPEIIHFGSSGLPMPSVEIKFLDHADAGYLSTNVPPQGEILIRGPSVTKGYFKRPEINAETFTEDGWLKTGDIGQWNADGTLSIIDRIKNLVKLSGGEYIALEKMESTYKSCVLVANMCIVCAQGAKAVVAVILPHEPNLRHALSSQFPDVAGKTLSEICSNDQVRQFVLQECNNVGAMNGMRSMERLGGIVLTADEWTPDNGMLTPAQKIQRGVVKTKYKEQITIEDAKIHS